MTAVGIAAFVIIMLISMFFDNFLMVIPGVITMVFLLIISRFMERRTQKGADAYAKCEALKRWLKDFSRLKERPVLDIKVWGEFLVYAYLFGVADEVIDELRDTVPELFTEDATLAASSYYVPWWYIYSTHSMTNGMPSFANSFASSINQSVAAVQSAGIGQLLKRRWLRRADSPVVEAAASAAVAVPDDKLPGRSASFSIQPASSDLAATTVYPLFIV